MKLVAFWSPNHGVGTTMDAVATALKVSMDNNLKSLLMHNQYIKSNMESAFLKNDEKQDILNFADEGIDAIARLAKAGDLTSEKFSNYTTNIIQDRLELLPGSSRPNENFFKEISSTITNILLCAKDSYDLVFIDTNSGTRNDLTNKILEAADVVVVCLSQNKQILDSYFNKKEYPKCFDDEGKEVLLLLSKYDSYSKYSTKLISKSYKVEEIYTMPYSTDVMDAHNNHKMSEFFFNNSNISEEDENTDFIEETLRLANAILECTEMKSEIIEDPIIKPSFSERFKSMFVKKD